MTVVSGMALGLDAVAQSAALDAGGNTIGVLGTGVDQIYPRGNARLFARVTEKGLLLSESPPGERGLPGAFPRRNRLISGLATALVVVEAAEDSGTLITVTCALEQGRDVYAVPGPINSKTSRGTNRLIRDGAVPILEPGDLTRALGLGGTESRKANVPFPLHLSDNEARVLASLRPDPSHVDELALSSGMSIGLLLGTLLGLEIGGLAEQLPGAMFRRRS
jgi:DNA processing protein